MKKGVRNVIIAIILFGIFGGWFIGYNHINELGAMKSIDFIASHFSGRGQIVDYQNDLGVSSIEDIKWYDNKKNIEIEFGKVRLKFNKKNFDSEEVQNALNRIHITVKHNEETDEYKIYYNGEEIDRYIRE